MYQGLQQANLIEDFLLAAQREQPVIQPWLFLPDEPGKGNGRPDIGQRFVSLAMIEAIGRAEQFQAQADLSIHLGPLNALWPQRVRRTHGIDQVPATVAALPLAGIRVEEIAVQAVAGDFIVEAQAVVAGAAGAGAGQFGVHPGHEVTLGQAVPRQLRRADAGDQAGCGVRQDIVAGPAEQIDRRFDFIEVQIRAHPGHLQRPVAARIDTGGFVVVPENGAHGGRLPERGNRRSLPQAEAPNGRKLK